MGGGLVKLEFRHWERVVACEGALFLVVGCALRLTKPRLYGCYFCFVLFFFVLFGLWAQLDIEKHHTIWCVATTQRQHAWTNFGKHG